MADHSASGTPSPRRQRMYGVIRSVVERGRIGTKPEQHHAMASLGIRGMSTWGPAPTPVSAPVRAAVVAGGSRGARLSAISRLPARIKSAGVPVIGRCQTVWDTRDSE